MRTTYAKIQIDNLSLLMEQTTNEEEQNAPQNIYKFY